MPGDVHTLPLILRNPSRVRLALLIYVGKASETIINQVLSQPQDLFPLARKPDLSQTGKLDFPSGSQVLNSKSRRIFQIGRRAAYLKGKNFPSFLSCSLRLLSKTNHTHHVHYQAGKVIKKRLRTADSGVKIGTNSKK